MFKFPQEVKVLSFKDEVVMVNLKENGFLKIRKPAWNYIQEFLNSGNDCLTKLNKDEQGDFFRLLENLKTNRYLFDTEADPEHSLSLEDVKKSFIQAERTAYYEVTHKCNLQCRFCYVSPAYEKKQIKGDLELSKRIMDKAVQLNITKMIISGGEPLLRGDFFELARYAKERFSKVYLTTNGTLIDAKKAEKLKQTEIDCVSISIESANAKVHDMLRGKGTFTKCLEAIAHLKKAGFSKESLYIISTLTKKNIDYIHKIREFADKLGVSSSFSFFQPVGTGKKHEKDLKFSSSDYSKFLFNVMQSMINETKCQIDSSVNVNISYDKLHKKIVPKLKNCCGMVINMLGIKENGDLVPCHLFFSMPDKKMNIGNILDNEILEKMWTFFQAIPVVDEKDICKDCNVRYFCGGGCSAGTYFNSKTLKTCNPYCDVFKNYYEAIVSSLGKENESESLLHLLSDNFS